MSFFSRMNATLRGFLIIAAIVVVIMVLNLYVALLTVALLVRFVFILAIAFFVYLVWRERRGDIAMWPARARVVLYGAAVLILADLGAWMLTGFATSYDRVAFLLVLALSGFAIWRVWREQRTWV
jgi:hypothetical protein